MSTQGKKIIILGAGFAGLFAAIELEKHCRQLPGVEVTLIDKNNYHMFVPLLYNIGSGGIEPSNICFPIRRILKNGGTVPPVMFREAEVTGIDLQQKTVFTDRGEFPYDYLVFALGSTTNFYGIPGLEQYILPLKTIEDGSRIHNKVLESFEMALLEGDEKKRRELLTFIIVGGGATGVELCSTMALFLFKTLSRDFPTLISETRLIMAEASGTLLHSMPPRVGQLAQKRLEKLGVEVILNCHVAKATDTGIDTKDGRVIPSHTVIWVGGIKTIPQAQGLQLEKAKDGRIIVKNNLEVASVPGLYVIGDLAYALQKGTNKAYPPTAQTAVRMGITCARNIAGEISGSCVRGYEYHYKGDLVTLGRNYAVGVFFGRLISGFPAFVMYRGYHLLTLMGFKNKIGTILDWTYDYFYRRSTVKLDADQQPPEPSRSIVSSTNKVLTEVK